MSKKRKIIIAAGIIIAVLILVGIGIVLAGNKSNNTASAGEVTLENDSVSSGETIDILQEESSVTENVIQETTTQEMTTIQETTTTQQAGAIQESKDVIEELSKTMYIVASANVRSGTSTDYDIIGKLTKGQAVEITGRSGEWYRIKFNDGEGFVHNTLLTDNQPEIGTTQAIREQVNYEPEIPTDNGKKLQEKPVQNQGQTASQPDKSPSQNIGENQTIANSSNIDEVIRLVNEERAKNGLKPLVKNNDLCKAADKRAEEIVMRFDHTRPDGSSCFTVLKEFGITYMAVGENIAAGQQSPVKVMESWMNSPGHRANILSSNFGEIGVGCISGQGGYGIYWVQIFKD